MPGRQVSFDPRYRRINCLELEPQRHLDLPRTADCLVGDAQPAERRANVQRSREALIARSRSCRRTDDRKAAEVDVLAYIVNGDIEACSVGHVENIEAVLEEQTFGDLGCLQ
jgi:hypothetical protein